MDGITLGIVAVVALSAVAVVVTVAIVVVRMTSAGRRPSVDNPAAAPPVVHPASKDAPDAARSAESLRETKAEIDGLKVFERSYRDALRNHLATLDAAAPDEDTRRRVADFRDALENPRRGSKPTARS